MSTKIVLAVVCVLASSATFAEAFAQQSGTESNAAIKSSFREKGIAKIDRLNQSELQQICSKYAKTDLPIKIRQRLEKKALESVHYPADGNYLGDWRAGEVIAQNGRGLQYSDLPGVPNGGNCYACHQITKEEIAFGTIGPSLASYGKLRKGNAQDVPIEIIKYTWAKIYNPHAFNACTNMPRFGDAAILTEAQMKDVMALLLDPKSPVNQ
jgi:sulfur-oxidizing protein SoxX